MIREDFVRIVLAGHQWGEQRAKQIEVSREMLAALRCEIRLALSALWLPNSAFSP